MMDMYMDLIHNKQGKSIVDLVTGRRNRSIKNIDRNILIEEYEKCEFD